MTRAGEVWGEGVADLLRHDGRPCCGHKRSRQRRTPGCQWRWWAIRNVGEGLPGSGGSPGDRQPWRHVPRGVQKNGRMEEQRVCLLGSPLEQGGPVGPLGPDPPPPIWLLPPPMKEAGWSPLRTPLQGCSLWSEVERWERTVPTPVLEASTSTTNWTEGSG